MVILETPISIRCMNVRMLVSLLTLEGNCVVIEFPCYSHFHVLKTLNAYFEKL